MAAKQAARWSAERSNRARLAPNEMRIANSRSRADSVRQHQVGNIGAGNEQDQSGGAEHQEERSRESPTSSARSGTSQRP